MHFKTTPLHGFLPHVAKAFSCTSCHMSRRWPPNRKELKRFYHSTTLPKGNNGVQPTIFIYFSSATSVWGEVFFKCDKMSPSTKTNVRGSPHFRKILGSSGSKDCTKQAAAWSVASILSHLTLNDDIYKAMEFVQVSIISYKLYINCYMLVVIADQHLASLACPIIRRFLPTSPYSLGGPVQSM